MKKLILLFCIALFCISCDPPRNGWNWVVVNNTGQALTLKFPYMGIDQTYILQPWERVAITKIHTTNVEERYNLNFDYYFEMVAGRHGDDVSWQLLSEDGIVLRTWDYSDRGLPDQRFFEESAWIKKPGPGQGAFIIATYSWTFNILREDIDSN